MLFNANIPLPRGRKKGEKKANIVVPVTNYQKDVLQQAINDRAELTGEGKANIVISLLANEFISVDGDEGWYIEKTLSDAASRDSHGDYPRKYGPIWGIAQALLTLAGRSFPFPIDKMARPYIELAAELALENDLRMHKPIFEDDPRYNLSNYYGEQFTRLLEKNNRIVTDELKDAFVREGEPLVYPVFAAALDNLDLLTQHNFLKCIGYTAAATDNWQDTAQERKRFANACIRAHMEKVSWKQEQERIELEGKAPILVQIPMKDGAYLKCPIGWRLVNPHDAISCNHAGAIAVRNKPDMPMYVFFLDHPISEMTSEEQLAMLRMADVANPQWSLMDTKNQEVELKHNPDGGKANYEEWLNSPRIGFFEIADAGDYPLGDPPGMAEVFRS